MNFDPLARSIESSRDHIVINRYRYYNRRNLLASRSVTVFLRGNPSEVWDSLRLTTREKKVVLLVIN